MGKSTPAGTPVVNYRAAQVSREEQQKYAYNCILIQKFDAEAYSTVIRECHDNHEEKRIVGISMRGYNTRRREKKIHAMLIEQ